MSRKTYPPEQGGQAGGERMNKKGLAMHIHTIRGLISYHERIALCSVGDGQGKKIQTPEQACKDIYLSALRCALGMMEREYGRLTLAEDDERETVRCCD